MEGTDKILMALDVLEEKANLSPDNKIGLGYLLEYPRLFDFLNEDDESLLLNKLHKEKVIELNEERDFYNGSLYSREITINLRNLRSYRNILRPSKSKRASLSSLILPDTRWEQIKIRFIDGHNIEITVNKNKIKANYKDLGFENNKDLKPNTLWELFRDLSENGGEIAWGDRLASDKIKKQKQLLSNALKKCFKINTDPFYPYKKEKSYRMKLIFLSQPMDIISENIDDRFSDLSDYIKDSMPSI